MSKREKLDSAMQLENQVTSSPRSKMDKEGNSKKKKKERNYAQLPRSCIKLCAKSAGYPALSDEVAALLAEDSNYRLTEIIFSACQFMRHSHREKLTAADISRALKWADVPLVYGPDDSVLVSNRNVNKNGRSAEDEYIDLLKFAKTETVHKFSTASSWTMQWLAMTDFSLNNKNIERMGTLSPDLQHYYNFVTDIVINGDYSMFDKVLMDMRSNSNIGPLLPFLVNFLYYAILEMKDKEQMSRIIMAVDCLISNKYLHFSQKHYSEVLTDTLFQSFKVMENDSCSMISEDSVNNHLDCQSLITKWSLLELTAEVLAKMNKELASTTEMSSKIFENLKPILHDGTKPFTSHYGAICTTLAFGPMAILDLLYPYIRENIQHLIREMRLTATSAHDQAALQYIYNALLTASVTLTKFIVSTVDAAHIEKLFNTFGKIPYDGLGLCIYKEFYEHFGDAFTGGLSSPECERIYRAHGLAPLFSREETKSATKILEDFYSQDIFDHKTEQNDHGEGSSGENMAEWSTFIKGSCLQLTIRKKKLPSSPNPKDSSQSPAHLATSQKNSAKKPKKVRKYVVPKSVFYRKLLSGNINNIL